MKAGFFERLAPRGRDRVSIFLDGGVATEHENVTVVEIELGKLAELMDAGELVDMKTLVLAQALKMRYAELFLPKSDKDM